MLRHLAALLLVLWIIPCIAQTFRSAYSERIALYPQQNDFRDTLRMWGMWQFKKDSLAVREQENWQNSLKEARSIAVPGSWKEQFTDSLDLEAEMIREEYQKVFIKAYLDVGDTKDFVAGMHVWAFSDFFSQNSRTLYHQERKKQYV